MTKGRKPTYTAAAGAMICAAIAEGASLRKACAAAGVKYATAQLWKESKKAFADLYARACETRRNRLEERLQELFELVHTVAGEENAGAKVQAVKVEIDSIKWILSKWQPARYGDKQHIEVYGKEDAPPVHVAADFSELTPEAQDITLARLRDIVRREQALREREREET